MVFEFICGKSTKQGWKTPSESAGKLHFLCTVARGRDVLISTFRSVTTLLMDLLATNGYDVWAIDIHGCGHSDKTDKDWSGVQSAAADIDAAVEYITKLRGVSKVDLLGWPVGTQRAALCAIPHPDPHENLLLHPPPQNG